jgi:hypothetical protein
MKSILKNPPLPSNKVFPLEQCKLTTVRSFGTEGRRGGDPKDEVPASDNVFEYIVFRGSDVKDLKVEEAAKKVEPPPRGMPNDPAILAVCHLTLCGFYDEQPRIFSSLNFC